MSERRAQIHVFLTGQLLSGRQVTDHDDLLLSGLVDSIGVMRLVAFLEQTYAVRVPPQDLTVTNFTSVEAIDDYLERLGAGAGA